MSVWCVAIYHYIYLSYISIYLLTWSRANDVRATRVWYDRTLICLSSFYKEVNRTCRRAAEATDRPSTFELE